MSGGEPAHPIELYFRRPRPGRSIGAENAIDADDRRRVTELPQPIQLFARRTGAYRR